MKTSISNQQSAISNQQSAISNQQSAISKLILLAVLMFSFNYINAQTNTLPSSGNVGIGTMNPNASLEVVGSTSLTGKVTIDSAVTVRDSATFQKKLTVNQDLKIKGSSVFVDNANFKSELKVLGVAKMKDKLVIDGLTQMKGDANVFGNFKIKSLADSTFSTDRWLTINPNGKLTSLDRSGLLESIYTSPSTCISTGVNVSLPVWSALSNANFGVLYTGIDCPARVGIGTNAPISTFQVAGDGFFQSSLGINIAPTNTKMLSINNPVNRTGIEIINNHPTTIALKYGIKNIVNNPNTIAYSVTDQANQDVFVVKGNGSVGIGTNNPDFSKLNVVAQDETGLTVTTNHTGDYGFGIRSIVAKNKTKAFSIYNAENNEESFVVLGNGSVYATKVIVQETPFPDYVFNTNYNLMPLGELEKYIKENKHLPNMPTAQQVEKQGADLGEINRLLVEKVEELTLYLIKLQKEIDELKK